MKVEKVNYNSFNYPAPAGSAPVGFGYSAGGAGKKPNNFHKPKEINKYIQTMFPWPIRLINKLKEAEGEVQNIVITALGTGLVAPVFIKYNFLSQKDEDTRTYGAWRQPISAGIAIVAQAIPVIMFNRLVQQGVNEGYFGEGYNMTVIPERSYLERIERKKVRAEHPNWSRYNVKQEAAKRASEKIAKLDSEFIDNIMKNNNIKYEAMVTGELKKGIVYDNKKYRKLVEQVLEDARNAQDYALNGSPETVKGKPYTGPKIEGLRNKIKRQANTAEYFSNNYDYCKETFKKIKSKLESTQKISEIDTQIEDLLKTAKKDGNTEMINILQGLRDRCALNGAQEIHNELYEEINSLLKYLDEDKGKSKKEIITMLEQKNAPKIKQIQGDMELFGTQLEAFKKDATVQQMSNAIEKQNNKAKIESYKEHMKIFIEDTTFKMVDNPLKKITKEKLQTFKNKFNILYNIDSGTNDCANMLKNMFVEYEDIGKKFLVSRLEDYRLGEQILERYKEIASANFKGKRTIIGVIVGAIMVVPTCLILNWAYPRIMDTVFPNLSRKRKNKINPAVNSEVKR